MSRLAAVAFVLAACQSGTSKPSGAPAAGARDPAPGASGAAPGPAAPLDDYAADVDRLCNAIHLSGADQQPAGAHQMMVAQWLPANMKTQKIHDFLAHFQDLRASDRRQALLDEAASVGLSGCALADEWK
jgi:hypothetical protein